MLVAAHVSSMNTRWLGSSAGWRRKQFVRFLQHILGPPPLLDTFGDAQGVEHPAILTTHRADIDAHPDRLTAFSYKAFLELEVVDQSCGCCPPLLCAFFPVIWMNNVEVGQPGQVPAAYSSICDRHLRDTSVALAGSLPTVAKLQHAA